MILEFVRDMAKSNIYVGLEVGTSKICVVVGEVRSDGTIKILGVGTAPSRGVRKGEIVDFDTAQRCLHDALVRAEDKSDVMIRNVFLSITGTHVESLNNRGCIRIPDDQSEITVDDLEEVKELARDVAIPPENVFLHSIVRHYIVDGQELVMNPVGMLGRKLEADYHIIHGIRNRIQNTIRCVREIPLEVEDVVFGPIAAAQVVLTKGAREQGALVVDVGGGTTDYVLYVDGSVAMSGSLGIGGDHITNDLSIVLKIPLSKAEKLKKDEGCAVASPDDEGQVIRVEGDTGFVGRDVDRELMNQVIHSRCLEIFELLDKRLRQGSYKERLKAGVFLTGGCSMLEGMSEVAEAVLSLPVHRGNTAPISGLTATFENPQFATPIGLIRYAQLLENERPQRSAISKLANRITGLFGGSRLFSWLFG
ncbi:MAG: cell division protein FtsA [Verrucomicrobia bacterium]|nr:cell division protein FtsA [Verrucomicrobiota bacterium]